MFSAWNVNNLANIREFVKFSCPVITHCKNGGFLPNNIVTLLFPSFFWKNCVNNL